MKQMSAWDYYYIQYIQYLVLPKPYANPGKIGCCVAKKLQRHCDGIKLISILKMHLLLDQQFGYRRLTESFDSLVIF